MPSSLTWTIDKANGRTLVALNGEFTEASDFASLLPQLASPVTLDLSGVRRINSAGVREWVNFAAALRKQANDVVLERCSVPVVHQMNMIANFRGDSPVRSIYAPYFCTSCNREHAELVELSQNVSLADSLPCPKCGATMEFDDLPDQFLSFHER